VSSDAARCVDTVLPYVNAGRVRLTLDPAISEDGVRPKKLRRTVKDALRSERRTALCSHRPVLPDIFKALGVTPVALEPSGIVVIHRHHGKIVAVEEQPWLLRHGATAGTGE
jgi:phosphohistidine phosphatase SixA